MREKEEGRDVVMMRLAKERERIQKEQERRKI